MELLGDDFEEADALVVVILVERVQMLGVVGELHGLAVVVLLGRVAVQLLAGGAEHDIATSITTTDAVPAGRGTVAHCGGSI